jgi:hypothetical protein
MDRFQDGNGPPTDPSRRSSAPGTTCGAWPRRRSAAPPRSAAAGCARASRSPPALPANALHSQVEAHEVPIIEHARGHALCHTQQQRHEGREGRRSGCGGSQPVIRAPRHWLPPKIDDPDSQSWVARPPAIDTNRWRLAPPRPPCRGRGGGGALVRRLIDAPCPLSASHGASIRGGGGRGAPEPEV